MNWKDVKKIIRKEILKEATEVNAGGSKFTLRTGVNKNPTKLGIKVQFEPKEGMQMNPDVKSKLEVALQEKLNDGLGKYGPPPPVRGSTVGLHSPLESC